MGQLGSKLRRVASGQGDNLLGYAHWCPACESIHVYAVDKPNSNGAKWTFNGDINAPSFSPSMLIRSGSNICHYFLTGGVISFCADCTHAMKGQSVPLPDLPNWLTDAPGH